MGAKSLPVRLCIVIAAATLGLIETGESRAAGDPWLRVDTQALTLTVLSGQNRVIARFHNISIGSGGVSAQRRIGDNSTPLGTFHVAWINRHSRYGIFFGLDYPAPSEAERAYKEGRITRTDFDVVLGASKRRQIPPPDTPLGGHIGIHGLGVGNPDIQRSINWTNGCVALPNREALSLTRWVHLGTKVVIR